MRVARGLRESGRWFDHTDPGRAFDQDVAGRVTVGGARRLHLPAASADSSAELVEYPVTAGSHPHDVAPAVDGGVWYTGQHNGTLGHLDPQTGEIREIDLGAGSRRTA